MAGDDYNELDDFMSDFEDFEFDGDLGNVKDNETVDLKTTAKKTVKKLVRVDPERGAKFIKAGLPKHVNNNIDKLTDLGSSVYDELDKGVSELKKEFDGAAKAFDSLLPESLQTIFRKFYTPEEEKQRRQELSEEEQLDARAVSELQESFGDLAKVQELTAKVNNQLSDKRTQSTNDILKTLGRDTAFIKEYTNEFTAKFQNKLLHVQLKSLYTLGDIAKTQKELGQLTIDRLSGILQNSAMPDVLKARSMSSMIMGEMKASARKGLAEKLYNNDLTKQIREKVKSKVGSLLDMPKNVLANTRMLLDNVGMVKEFNEALGNNLTDTGSDLAADTIDAFIAKKLFSYINKNEKVKGAYNQFTDYMSDPTRFALDVKEKIGDDNLFSQIINNIIAEGVELVDTKNSAKSIDLTRADLDEPDQLDVRTKLTINQVIPGYLGRLYGEIRAGRLGSKEADVSKYNLVYDYQTRNFKTSGNLLRRIKRGMANDVAVYKNRTYKELDNHVFKKLDLGDKLSKKGESNLKNYMMIKARSYDLDPGRLSKMDPEQLAQEARIDVDEAREFLAQFSSRIEDDVYRSELVSKFRSIGSSAPGFKRHIEEAIKNGDEELLIKLGYITKNTEGELKVNDQNLDHRQFLNNEGKLLYDKGDDTGYTPDTTGGIHADWSKVNNIKENFVTDAKKVMQVLYNEGKNVAKQGYDYTKSKHEELLKTNKHYKKVNDLANKYYKNTKDSGGEFFSKYHTKATEYFQKQLEQHPEIMGYIGKGGDIVRKADSYIRAKIDVALDNPKLKKYKNQGLLKAMQAKDFGKKKLDEVLKHIDPELKDLVVELYQDAKGKAVEGVDYLKDTVTNSELYQDAKKMTNDVLQDETVKKILKKGKEVVDTVKDKAKQAYDSVVDGSYLDSLPTEVKEEIKQATTGEMQGTPINTPMKHRVGKFVDKVKSISSEAWNKVTNFAKTDSKIAPEVLKAVMIDGELHVLTDSEGKPIEATPSATPHNLDTAVSDTTTKMEGVDLETIEREIGTIDSETKAAEAIERAAESGNGELIRSIVEKTKSIGLGGSKIIADAATRAYNKIKTSESMGGLALGALKKVANPWEAFMLAFKLSKLGYNVMPFKAMTKLSGSLLWNIMKKGHHYDWKYAKGLTMGLLKGGLGAVKGIGRGVMSGAKGAYNIGKGTTKAGIWGLTAGKYGKGWAGDLGRGALGLGGMVYNPLAGTVKGFGSGFKQGWNSNLRSPLQLLGSGLKRVGGKYYDMWHGDPKTPEEPAAMGVEEYIPPEAADMQANMQYQAPIGPQLPEQKRTFFDNAMDRTKNLLSKGKDMLKFRANKEETEKQDVKEQTEALATMSAEAMILNANPEVQEELLKNQDVPSIAKLKGSRLFKRMRVKMRQFIRKGKKGLGIAGGLLGGLFSGISSLFGMGKKGILMLLGGMGITGMLKSLISGIGSLLMSGFKGIVGSVTSVVSSAISGIGSMLGGVAGKAVDVAKAGASWVGEKFSGLVNWGKEKLGFGSSTPNTPDPKAKPVDTPDTKGKTYESEKAAGKKQAKAAKKKVANDGFIKKLTKTVGDLKDRVLKALTKGAKKMSKSGALRVVARLSFKMGIRLVPILGTAMLVWDSWEIYQYVQKGHSVAGAICMTYIGIDPFMDEGSAEESAEQLVEEGQAREDQKGEVKDNLMSTSTDQALEETARTTTDKTDVTTSPTKDTSNLLDGVNGIQETLIKIHQVEIAEMRRTRDEIVKIAKHIMSSDEYRRHSNNDAFLKQVKNFEDKRTTKQEEFKPIAQVINSSNLDNVNSQRIVR